MTAWPHWTTRAASEEALKGSTLGEFWKYRVSDYRVIASIEDHALCVLVVKIGNRREVYQMSSRIRGHSVSARAKRTQPCHATRLQNIESDTGYDTQTCNGAVLDECNRPSVRSKLRCRSAMGSEGRGEFA